MLNNDDLIELLRREFFNPLKHRNYFSKHVVYKETDDESWGFGGEWWVADALVKSTRDDCLEIGHYLYGDGGVPTFKVGVEYGAGIENIVPVLLSRLNLIVISALADVPVDGLGFRYSIGFGMPDRLKKQVDLRSPAYKGENVATVVQNYLENNKDCGFDTIVTTTRVLRELRRSAACSDLVGFSTELLGVRALSYDETYRNSDGVNVSCIPYNTIIFLNWKKFVSGESFCFKSCPVSETLVMSLLGNKEKPRLLHGPVSYATCITDSPFSDVIVWELLGVSERVDPNCSGAITIPGEKANIL